ncbi:MAG: acetate--CoA ligase family protein, partial [Candidatus Omnitrophica bacterium]|nr:acetate--CoA ligase family protein [Candidatus Omnitrophota bacterium]
MTGEVKIFSSADPSHDIWKQGFQPLEPIFKPRSVAVLGATDRAGSVGRSVMENLGVFKGGVYPINPKRAEVLGHKAYPGISELKGKVDLAVIATPAPTVPDLVKECVDAGVKGAIVLSAGFKERGEPGIELERQILSHIKGTRFRVIGPNCLGMMNPVMDLNASFASKMAQRGNVGFISQSGALCTAILDWSFRENVGFSSFISIGSMLDVDWGDLIDYLGNDPHTKSILLYMESIGNPESFLSAAREVAMTKPIIVIKAGRTAAAAQAAASHTGSLTGSDEALEAAFRRCGVLRVDTISELFEMAEVLAKQPRPKGPRLSIVTNAGGPGVLATDALVRVGGKLAVLSDETRAALDGFLPPHWSHANPVDILGDADAERYAKSLEVLIKDSANDGVLVVLTPQAMTDSTRIAEDLAKRAKNSPKPVLASWMGGEGILEGRHVLRQGGVPDFSYPDDAARTFQYMWAYSENLRALYETPTVVDADPSLDAPDRLTAYEIIREALRNKKTLLSEYESKKLLEAYRLPTVRTEIARTPEEAVRLAEGMGYPVVLKLLSETITHKTDVGGVQLNLTDAEAVRKAYERIEKSVEAKAGPGHFDGVTVQ